MRKWEDIVKDKLEGAGGSLPESVFAEFRARREAAAAAPAPKRFPLVWAVVPAVAAGLAAVLLLRRPDVPEEGIQILQTPAAPVAVVTDSLGVVETVPEAPLVARAFVPKGTRQAVATQKQTTGTEVVAPAEEVIPSTDPAGATLPQGEAHNGDPDVQVPGGEASVDSPAGAAIPPFVPENNKTRPVMMKVGPAAGMIAGGGLLAAAIPGVFRKGTETVINPIYYNYHYDTDGIAADIDPTDKPTGDFRHCFPLKLGLSAGAPVGGRFFVTTGLSYSLYQSSIAYSVSGEKRQTVQYLGIPLRLDWLLASGDLVDVYAGGGLQGDFCIGASLGRTRIQKDGPSLSLVGVGGVQIKMTKHIGFYMEPELSWRIPSGKNVLQTYRSERPLMFSVNAGLRINIDSK